MELVFGISMINNQACYYLIQLNIKLHCVSEITKILSKSLKLNFSITTLVANPKPINKMSRLTG
jgi:hypothetical protein